MGKSLSRSPGVAGFIVPGWMTGARAPGMSGMMLYQWVGIRSSPRTNFVCMRPSLRG